MSAPYLSLVKAEYDFTATDEGDLTIEEGSVYYLVDNSHEDWWMVRIKSDRDDAPSGLVPSAYVKDVEPISYAKAQYDFEATCDGELTIKEDDELLVLEKDDGWWLVKNTKPDSRLGLVPGNYLEERPIPSSSEVRHEAEHGSVSFGTHTDPQERQPKSHKKPIDNIMAASTATPASSDIIDDFSSLSLNLPRVDSRRDLVSNSDHEKMDQAILKTFRAYAKLEELPPLESLLCNIANEDQRLKRLTLDEAASLLSEESSNLEETLKRSWDAKSFKEVRRLETLWPPHQEPEAK